MGHFFYSTFFVLEENTENEIGLNRYRQYVSLIYYQSHFTLSTVVKVLKVKSVFLFKRIIFILCDALLLDVCQFFLANIFSISKNILVLGYVGSVYFLNAQHTQAYRYLYIYVLYNVVVYT